jgi:SnoaL-like domain
VSDFHELVNDYIATWNETDTTARRARIDTLWTDDASLTDPMTTAEGKDAIDATVAAVQAQFPGLVFRLVGPVDAHHDQARFTWAACLADGEDLVVGFDVAVFAGGRIRNIYGFLDKVPAL